jgi:hypothetical protein
MAESRRLVTEDGHREEQRNDGAEEKEAITLAVSMR